MRRLLPALCALGLALPQLPAAAPLTTISNVCLSSSASNDGDSFVVEYGGTQLVVRLYAVDCPETSASSLTLMRIREQMRYFGHTNPALTVTYGARAAVFARRALSEPFTLHTRFASALGSSRGGRVYAFVTTAEGEDLGTLLVRKGLARARGICRSAPDGTALDEVQARLHDAEMAAMLGRQGAWSRSDPQKLAQLRAAERAEGQALAVLKQAIRDAAPPVDINSASIDELKKLHGVGDVRAGLIVRHRPYRTLDELTAVKGIPSSIVSDNADRIRIRSR